MQWLSSVLVVHRACLCVIHVRLGEPDTLTAVVTFWQDNASCHSAKDVQEWFEEHVKNHEKEFKVLTWSANFPELNLISHQV